jgi:HSP20 family protein
MWRMNKRILVIQPEAACHFHAALRFSPWQSIKVDIATSDDRYVVRIPLPGVDKGDIDVTVDGNEVTVSVRGRSRGRPLGLGQRVDTGRATARYEVGVLELVLPKLVGPTGCRVPVR